MEVTLAGMSEFAEQFVTQLPSAPGDRAHVVGLSGDLGAGKTTFVQSVAKILGSTGVVTSPTFVLVQCYRIDRPPFRTLIHVDAYRLNPGEAHTIGWEEYLADPTNLIVVEWPDKMFSDFPADAKVLKFTVTGDDTRDIEYVKE